MVRELEQKARGIYTAMQEIHQCSRGQSTLVRVKVHKQARAVYRNFAKGGSIWGMEKRGGWKLCACKARHLGGSGGMLPRENFVIFSALSFNLKSFNLVQLDILMSLK